MLFNIPLVRSLGLMPLHTFQAASQDVAQLPAWKTTWSDKGRFSKPGTGHKLANRTQVDVHVLVPATQICSGKMTHTHTPQKTLDR